MSLETLETVMRKVLAYAEENCTIAFQGGEPTLCGLDFFEKLIEIQKRHNVNGAKIQNVLQTNGYHLDQKWFEFFHNNMFLIGISLDGGPKIHNCYRKNTKKEETFFTIMKNIELLGKRPKWNLTSCIYNRRTAPAIRKTYEFYRKNHLNYLQFIACLDPRENHRGSENIL